jgi:hypothetical protein
MLLGAFRPLARTAIAHNLDSSYDTFPVLSERRRQLAGSLSGGEQQMLALARALMSAPKILLIDEAVGRPRPGPRQAHDREDQGIEGPLPADRLDGRAELHQAVRIADRGYVIVHGKIAFEGGSAATSSTITSWSGNSIWGSKEANLTAHFSHRGRANREHAIANWHCTVPGIGTRERGYEIAGNGCRYLISIR